MYNIFFRNISDKTSDTENDKSGHFSGIGTKTAINRNIRGIWKVLSMVFYPCNQFTNPIILEGVQWLSGRVLDSRPKGCWFEPHRRH